MHFADDLVLAVVANFCSLRDARNMYGTDHIYIQNRSAKVVTRAIRNFAGMVRETRNTLEDPELVEAAGHTFWTRAYFCIYPKQFAKKWHQAYAWKRQLMSKYVPAGDLDREYTRLELFRLQRTMDFDDMLAIGW